MKLLLLFSFLIVSLKSHGFEDSPCEGDTKTQKMKLEILIETARAKFKDTGVFPVTILDVENELGEKMSIFNHDSMSFDEIEHGVSIFCGVIAKPDQTEVSNILCEGGLYVSAITCRENFITVVRDPS